MTATDGEAAIAAPAGGVASAGDVLTGNLLGSEATHTLLVFLDRRRTQLHMSHNAFARFIGLTPATWSLVRRGLEPAGPAFIGRVVVALPEAAPYCRRRDRPISVLNAAD